MKIVTKSGHGTLFAGKMKEHTHYEQTEREELLEDIHSGSLKNKDVTFYNVGECELSWDTDYYDLGKQVKSWTEINGMVSEHAAIFDPNKPVPERPYNAAARFIPKLDNVKIISYPWMCSGSDHYSCRGSQIPFTCQTKPVGISRYKRK